MFLQRKRQPWRLLLHQFKRLMYYKAIYEENTSFLFKGSKPGNSPSLMNVMMELRKCCNQLFLICGAEERILVDAALSDIHHDINDYQVWHP